MTSYAAPPILSYICQFLKPFTFFWLPSLVGASMTDLGRHGEAPTAMSQVTMHSESHVHTFCPRAVAQLKTSYQLATDMQSILSHIIHFPRLPTPNHGLWGTLGGPHSAPHFMTACQGNFCSMIAAPFETQLDREHKTTKPQIFGDCMTDLVTVFCFI